MSHVVPKQHCVLCTEDGELQENVTDYLKDLFSFWPVDNPAAALAQVERRSHCLILVDLRFENALPLLISFSRKKGYVVVALGEPGSAPYVEAIKIGVHSIGDINAAYGPLQVLLEQAAKQLISIEESDAIAARLADQAARQLLAGGPGVTLASSLNLNRIDVITDILRKIHSPTDILETVLEEISRQYLPTSVGVLTHVGPYYQLRSGVRCPEEAWNYRISLDDPFVRWLKIHGQLISKKGLAVIENSESRLMLGQILDTFGADVLIPLSSGSCLLGWLFLGRQINGQSYSSEHFLGLLSIAEQLSEIVKFTIDIERVTQRHQHAQGILASLPYGVLLLDEHARIVWSNELARHLLGLEDEHLHKEVDFIDTILADVVHRAAGGNGRIAGAERPGKKGASPISIQGRSMDSNPKTTIVIVEEASERHADQRRAERVDEIATRIRSALTLVTTFSQLLSEKADDPNFIQSFGQSMGKQVEELTSLSRELGMLRKTNCLSS